MKEIRTVTLRGETLSLDEIARALSFPACAARNLDALYDCLTELSYTVLFIVNPDARNENARLLRVIFDAAAENPQLWVYTITQKTRGTFEKGLVNG